MIATQPPDFFNVNQKTFEAAVWDLYKFQQHNNAVYRDFVAFATQTRGVPHSITGIPFLPVSFFKNHPVKAFAGEPQKVFTSSGTTGAVTSSHYVKSLEVYEQSFLKAFELFYGHPSQYAILSLLPAYLEREGSSLVYMAQKLAEVSGDPDSGFFLRSAGHLHEVLSRREADGKRSLLLGVTFALLDYAETLPQKLQHTIVMETGGMKGRRMEITRKEVHATLQQGFGIAAVHSEYGMTELLSQAYSMGNGLYRCPPWMKILVRDEDDPFAVKEHGTGIVCVIDLANRYSCGFIETADLGTVYADGSFEILGRLDNSDIRGCSLLVP